MGKINKIAVLYGGSSSEREISLQSGMGVHSAICDLGYESDLIDFKNLSNLYELKVYDFVFIALHGFEGEGGKLQKDLDDFIRLLLNENDNKPITEIKSKTTEELISDRKLLEQALEKTKKTTSQRLS